MSLCLLSCLDSIDFFRPREMISDMNLPLSRARTQAAAAPLE